MPTVRQKWAKFVQQPMLTCWQASISWPVVASVNELARPPRRLRDSSSVTRKPRGARAVAAARPASPPPMHEDGRRTHDFPPQPHAGRHGTQEVARLPPPAELTRAE